MKMNYKRSSDELTVPLLNSEENSSKFQLKEGRLLTYCFLLGFIGIILAVCSLPITQIVIGSLYINQCPVDNFIPIHLLITGLATLILLIICVLTVRFFFLLKCDFRKIYFYRFFVKNRQF